jgi:hypothetical protein
MNQEQYQEELQRISNDMSRWYQNRYEPIDRVKRLYQRDLALASERLDDMVYDIGRSATHFINLSLGDQPAYGYIFTAQPYDTVVRTPAEAKPNSEVALRYTEHYYGRSGDFLRSVPYFGNGKLYFSCRALAKTIHQGSELSIKDIALLPGKNSYQYSEK